jgi:hypothetical protein
MSRIHLADLPALWTLSAEEMEQVVGAGTRFRPSLEPLEEREVPSASFATSTLGGVTASFSLNNGVLTETSGPHVGVMATGVQGLYQGTNAAHQQVAFDWTNHVLKEFTPNHGWVSLGSAGQVAQEQTENPLFTEGSSLFLATGIPAATSAGRQLVEHGV